MLSWIRFVNIDLPPSLDYFLVVLVNKMSLMVIDVNILVNISIFKDKTSSKIEVINCKI